MRDRLIELVDKAKEEYANDVTDHTETEYIVESLLNNGVIVTPCVTYNKKHERYQTVHTGKQGHIFSSKFYRTRKEAEQKLKGGEG